MPTGVAGGTLFLACDPAFQANVVTTCGSRNDVCGWAQYARPQAVRDQADLEAARAHLLNEAKERALTLTPEEVRLHPAKMAPFVATRLWPGVMP